MSERKVVIPRFEILRRGEVIRTVPLNRNHLVIGSEDGASLRLKHPAIAPRHLEVTVVGGKYLEAANLAGEGRVLLGGQPMNKARLREGDELDLGPVSLRLSYARSEASPPPEAAAPQSDAFDDEEPTDPGGDAPSVQPPPDEGLSDVELDDNVLDPTPVVVIEPPGGRAQRVPLRVGSFVVGAGRCAFRLSYPGVAPAHAEIMVMPDGVAYVKHLAGSGLLTLRNGAPVQFSRWVTGDRLQIGPVTMQLESVPRAELMAPPPSSAPAATPRAAKPPPSSPLPSLSPATGDRIPKAPPPPPPKPAAVAPPPAVVAPPPAAVAPPPARPAPSKPLVRARRSTPPKVTKKAPAAQPARPPVQVQLHVSSQDTFASLLVDDEPLSNLRPWWQRAALPALVLLLLGIVSWQGYRLMHMNDTPAANGGPRTASGASGVHAGDAETARAGNGPIRVGDFESSRKGGRPGARGGSRADGGNIDWEDQRGGVYFEGARRAGAGEQQRIPLHAADELTERNSETAAPAEVASGVEQGFVEMKHVEAAIYDGRRKLRYCYTNARQDDSSLEGIMWLTVTLTGEGRMRGAVQESRSTLKSESMRKCLERQLYALDMPRPTGGSVTFSYPFEFHSSE